MRSLRSFLIERLLKRASNKHNFTDEKAYAKFLKKRQRVNDKPYALPRYLQKHFNIKKQYFDEMECYIYNYHLDAPEHIVLYLHGGGYIKQPSLFHWLFIGKIAKKANAVIVVPIYPKAPNHTYKQSFDKVLKLYEAVLDYYHYPKMILMGDSAGGGFALALAQLLVEKQLTQPKKIIMFSPWLDVTMKNEAAHQVEQDDPMLGIYGLVEMGKAYAGETDTSHYMLSPINGGLEGLGELTLVVGTHDVLWPDAKRFNQMVEAKGIQMNYFEYPKMNHIFIVFPIPEAKNALKKVLTIINAA